MVSAGSVSAHSDEVKQASTNYRNQIEGLASSWTGPSFDNLSNQCNSFYSEIQQVVSQLLSFSEAVGLYAEYMEVKAKKAQYQALLNSLGDDEENQSLASQYSAIISECETKMRELADKINAALEAASSFKMDGSSTNTESATITETKTETTKISTEGGSFIPDNQRGLYGHMTTSINGNTHMIYKQSQITGWSGDCNRAAASSIASGFATSEWQAVDIAKKSADGIGYKSDVTNAYFNNFGLQANVKKVNGKYDTVKNDIVSNLSQGNYVMFDLDKPTVGSSGQRWTFKRHWVSVLDMKQNSDGSYAIFISDSGHAASTVDHGLGTGWYSLDEFDGKTIANFTTISPK